MSDETNQETRSDVTINNANVTTFVSSLALAVNSTYSYNNSSSLFCSLIPAYDRDYAWRYVRPACQWLDGYVPSLHDGTSGIISTRIGTRLITGLTKQIVGEQLIFKQKDEIDNAERTLDEVGKWNEKQKPIRAVYGAVGYACGIGTSLIKLNVSNKNGEKDIWWEAKRLDSSYYLADNKGDVKEAKFYIRAYTDTRENKEGHKSQYILCERRFYKTYDKPEFKDKSLTELLHKKGDKVPMVEYQVYRTNGTILNNTMPIYESTICTWEEISSDVRDMIKENYDAIRIGEPMQLPFTNLGVGILKNGNTDLSVPAGSGFGESLLVGIQSDMIVYEYAESCLIRDMYLGKGTLYLPKNLSMGDLTTGNEVEVWKGGVLSSQGGMDTGAVEMMSGIDPEQQKAIVQQFNIRGEEWQTIKENALKDIAIKWGMSAKILASYLAGGAGQQTATQVDSEDDMSIAFINLTRSYFLPVINDLLETTLQYKGLKNNVSVNFATPSLVNKDRQLDRIIKLLENGLIDIEEAIRSYYPDLSESEIERKINIAKIERQKAQEQAQMQFDSYGQGVDEFGDSNHYDDLGGDNLNGSTEPSQK